MEKPSIVSVAERVKSLLDRTVLVVENQQQWLIEKQLLGLALADIVSVSTLSTVAKNPIKADDQVKIDHRCILPRYTELSRLTRPRTIPYASSLPVSKDFDVIEWPRKRRFLTGLLEPALAS